MRDRNVRHASGEIDVWKSSVGNDELDSDKQSFWVQNGIGRRFLSPDVFSDGLYTGGESFCFINPVFALSFFLNAEI